MENFKEMVISHLLFLMWLYDTKRTGIRNKWLETHPPHSYDFSRKLGGCGRPCILETLCFTFKWPKSVIRKNTVQAYWFWCLMYSSSHENATSGFFNQILRIAKRTPMKRVFFGNRKGPVFCAKDVAKSRTKKPLINLACIRILLMFQYT